MEPHEPPRVEVVGAVNGDLLEGARFSLVADVTIDANSGAIRVERFHVVHDCGQINNPAGVRAQIEGNMIQTTSHTLMEELTFDRQMVTSLDWASYPIIRFKDVPEVRIDLIDRPQEVPWGVGEPAMGAGVTRIYQLAAVMRP